MGLEEPTLGPPKSAERPSEPRKFRENLGNARKSRETKGTMCAYHVVSPGLISAPLMLLVSDAVPFPTPPGLPGREVELCPPPRDWCAPAPHKVKITAKRCTKGLNKVVGEACACHVDFRGKL